MENISNELLIKNIGTKDYKLFFQELSDLVAEHCYSFEIEENESFPVQPQVKTANGGKLDANTLTKQTILTEKKYYKCSDCGKAVEYLKEGRCNKCYWIKRDIDWSDAYDNCYGDD